MNTEPLSAAEVEELPEGTPVTVTWSGGNGPHAYVITVREDGGRYAWSPDRPERLRWYNPLSYVGKRSFETRVWLR